jgi:hypothetical protein
MEILFPPELPAQFGFGFFQRAAAAGGQVLAGAVEIRISIT